jgi:hypothetical protein
LVVPQNRWEDEDVVGHASRSSGLLRLEPIWARVSQFDLKTGGGTTWTMHVASWWRSREDEAEDGWVHAMGCIGLFYPNFTVFIILGPRGIIVFWLGL